MILASYLKPNAGIPTGRIVSRVLVSKGWTQKTAAIHMGGLHYESTFSRGLSGLAPLDLHALLMLDAKVLWKLFRVLLHAKLAVEERELFSEEQRRA